MELYIGDAMLCSFPIYEATVIADDGDIDGGELDSDGENLDFEALISQLFELLLTLVGNNRYKGLVAGSVGQLMYTVLAYMQMTRDQAITWARDPNQVFLFASYLMFPLSEFACVRVIFYLAREYCYLIDIKVIELRRYPYPVCFLFRGSFQQC
jgi:hypothetical protein